MVVVRPAVEEGSMVDDKEKDAMENDELVKVKWLISELPFQINMANTAMIKVGNRGDDRVLRLKTTFFISGCCFLKGDGWWVSCQRALVEDKVPYSKCLDYNLKVHMN